LIDKASGRVIGSTRYGNIDCVHHRLEIGWTWVARPWQRSAINTEGENTCCCAMPLKTLKCIRVELKTDSLNDARGLRSCASERVKKEPSAIT